MGTENYVVCTVHEGTCNALSLLKKLRFHSARRSRSVSEARRQTFASKASLGSKVAAKKVLRIHFSRGRSGCTGATARAVAGTKCRSESPAESSLLKDEERNQELEQTEQP